MNNTNTTSIGKETPAIAEITIKAVILAIIITAILAAANAYLALKLGQTISASIPAAVIAMAALRLFKNHTILENNIVQTAASGGEGVAAAVCFVLPALVITGYWKYFHYWETALMTLVGGFLGVLFSIPLRRVMLNYPTLRFPEGTAIGNVVKASASGTAKMRHLLQGSIVGAVIGLFQTGFKVLSDSLSLWTTSGKALYGFTVGFSPALLGAGFIVGMEACMAMLVGLVLAWVIGVPVYTMIYGLPHATNYMDMVMAVRSDHLRYIGIGTMLFGGLWTLITLIKPIALGVYASFQSLRTTKRMTKVARVDRDIPIIFVLIGSIVLAILTYFSFLHFFHFDKFRFSGLLHYGLPFFSLCFVMIIGFLMAAICAYLSGLVGMTNNPLSGLLLGSVLLASVLLLPMIGHILRDNPEALKSAITLVLITTTMVAIIIAISGENMQDLKAGQMVGATPWKQQVILMVGVVVAAFVVGPTLELLFQAYGIGGVFPRPGMDPTQMLAAPQAGLMETVASGTFGGSLPLLDIGIGVLIAMIAAVIDGRLKKKGHRLAILAIGIGIYLPPDITSAVIIGGALNYVCKRVVLSREKSKTDTYAVLEQKFETPIMVCCGLVAGAALIGVILAIPFVLKGSSDALSLVPASFAHTADILGLIGTVILCGWIYRITVRKTPA